MVKQSTFEVLPAIDVRGGGVVRLAQGDFGRETTYDADPVAAAVTFATAGAAWLHVVDLDAARTGLAANRSVVQAIVAAVGKQVGVEAAGGFRTAEAVAAAFEMGAARVVIGTAAVADPSFAGTLVDRHGTDRIVVALDVRDGMAIGHGWQVGAPGVDVSDAIASLADQGVGLFEVTSIERDGLLEGPDLTLLRRVVRLRRGAVIASGGITTLGDLQAVREIGCRGAIVGRALYEGRLDLTEALSVADVSGR
jgi:phosphoribosylformimino-5-aminoimidazole carboxamide ribotide isomerase